MSLVSVNGRACHRAELVIPWSGCWVLRVWLDGPPPAGRVTVAWGGSTLVGTVQADAQGSFLGEGSCVIVGGAGWSSTPRALWLQNDDPGGLSSAAVAQQLAREIGESLVLDSSALRPGRVAHARARQPAALTLGALLAAGAVWWVDLDGTTHAAASRPAPVLSSDVVLELDPSRRRALLDVEHPGQVPVGAVIPASGERWPATLRLRELRAEAGPEGLRFWGQFAEEPTGGPRIAALVEQLVRGAEPAPHATWRRAAVESQGPDGRVSLRLADRGGELPDPKPVPVWCGVPGVSAKVYRGAQTWLAFGSNDPTQPFAALWSPMGQGVHVPRSVAHEAVEEIRFVGNSLGLVRVGPGSAPDMRPVAMAPAVASMRTALDTFASAVAGAADLAAVKTAAGTLHSALAAITGLAATRLEAT